jgi:hypothetical protein
VLKRFLVLLIAVILLLTCFTDPAVEVFAAPQTHPNTYKNTGDQITDLIGVALTQVGYQEGPGNDTKYGEFFNLNYHAWCGLFVSWCAVQAGIPDSVMVKTGIASPQAFGLTQHPRGYQPKRGDLYFTPNYSHVGIVYYVDGDYIYTLEGNTWETAGYEGVHIRKKRISEVVFATPKYTTGCKHTYTKGYDTAHPHKEYQKCTSCGYSYYTGATTMQSNCNTCIQLNCKHTYGKNVSVNHSVHKRSCTLCGKSITENHSFGSWKVIKYASCKESGKRERTCQGCGFVLSETISKINDHKFNDWEMVDDKNHSRTCTVCGKVEQETHEDAEGWVSDGERHWHACGICEGVLEEGEHEFGTACDSPCSVCDYIRESGHPFDSLWKTDLNKHWKSCKNCDAVDAVADHIFDTDCDAVCNTCGFTRGRDHTYSDEWMTDGVHHWKQCSICGGKKDVSAHVPTQVSRKGALQYCTICDLCLTSDAEHTHGFDTFESNAQYHSGTCSCGLELEPEVHVWTMQSGICQVCGALQSQMKEAPIDYIPICFGAGSVVLVVILIVLLVFGFKKKK